mmetsp:Transcript_54137/g.159280  ORF Transcript_54137/g.159280 Transcript_54137/m.159280 type:complete len:217 (-) Transcript_54137:85-735(-)
MQTSIRECAALSGRIPAPPDFVGRSSSKSPGPDRLCTSSWRHFSATSKEPLWPASTMSETRVLSASERGGCEAEKAAARRGAACGLLSVSTIFVAGAVRETQPMPKTSLMTMPAAKAPKAQSALCMASLYSKEAEKAASPSSKNLSRARRATEAPMAAAKNQATETFFFRPFLRSSSSSAAFLEKKEESIVCTIVIVVGVVCKVREDAKASVALFG